MRARRFLFPTVIALAAGCKTTTTEDYTFAFPDSSSPPPAESSVLDTRLKQLEKLSTEYPKRSDIPYQIAGVYYQKEAFRDSAKALEKAIYIEPSEAKYHYHLGRVRLRMNELEPAEKEFRQVISLLPPGRYTGGHGALGYVLCKKGIWREALDQYENCTRIDPRDPNSWYYIGCIEDVLGDREKAADGFRRYLGLGGVEFRTKAKEILAGYGVLLSREEEEDGDRAARSAEAKSRKPLQDLLDPLPTIP